jgi:glycosyltransferase involved in cell wall biosynthesis
VIHNPPIKILHAISSTGFYGAEKMLLQLAVGQRESGKVQPHVAHLRDPDSGVVKLHDIFSPAGIPCSEVPFPKGIGYPGWKNWKEILDGDWDLVHSHGYKPNVLLSLSGSRSRRLPFITTCHGQLYFNTSLKMRLNLVCNLLSMRTANAVVSVSEFGARDLKRYGIRRVEVIHNGVPFPSYETEGSGRNGSFRIGTVGRLSKEKGQTVLLSAFRILSDSLPGLSLKIAGEGEEREELRKQAVSLGIEPQVEFSGYVRDVWEVYKELDVFVLPSHTEGIPLALLEAMAAGVPVVATRVGGVPEIVRDGQDGLLVPPRDPEAAAVAIRRILCEPTLRKTLSVNGRERVARHFSLGAMTESYFALYRKVTRRESRFGREEEP